MTRLILRAMAWVLPAIFLIIGLNHLYFMGERNRIQTEIVRTMLDMGLGDVVAQLEKTQPDTRERVLVSLSKAVRRDAVLVTLDELPTEFDGKLAIDERTIWLLNGTAWAQIDGHHVLRFSAIPLPNAGGILGVGQLLLTVLIVLVASAGIVGPLVRRLRKLSLASRQLALGNLSVRVNDPSDDAIGQVAQQFDDMAATLQFQKEEQSAFLNGIAHELATPLARLEFALELLKEAEGDASRREREQSLHREFTELTALADEILEWACQAPDVRLKLDVVDVGEVLADLVFRTAAPGIVINIDIEVPFAAEISAERRSLQRALDNVLRNAVSYAKSKVNVRVETSSGSVDVWIEDDGPGIPEAQRGRVFEPFTRADASRDRRTGGAGLGLSIVRRVVERHGGTVAAHQSATLGGAALLIRWPVLAGSEALPKRPGSHS